MYKSRLLLSVLGCLILTVIILSCGDNKGVGPDNNQVTFESYFDFYEYQRFNSVAEDSDGNIIAGGRYDYRTIDTTYSLTDSVTDYNALIVKYDKNGDTLWTINYGTTDHHQEIYKIIPASPGGYMALISERQPRGTYSPDLRFQKIAVSGEIGESNIVEDVSYPWIKDMIQTSDNGYVVVGHASGRFQRAKLFVMKVDSDGNKLWEKQIEDGEFNRVVELADYSLLMAGDKWDTSTSSNNIYIMKCNADGDSLFAVELNFLESAYARDIMVTKTGGYRLTGSGYSNNTYFNYIVDIDQNGVAQKAKLIYNYDNFWSVIARFLPDGSVAICGHRYYPTEKGYLVKINSNGESSWLREFDNDGMNIDFYGFTPVSDGGYLICGKLYNPVSALYEACLFKTNSSGEIE